MKQRKGHALQHGEGQWSARRIRDGFDGPVWLAYEFPTVDGRIGRLWIPNSTLRHQNILLDTFADRIPHYPPSVGVSDKAKFKFIASFANDAVAVEVVPRRTGFVDQDTFVTWTDVIHRKTGRLSNPWPRNSVEGLLVDVRGTIAGTRKVLQIAEASSYLVFAVGVVLAAPLLSYLEQRQIKKSKALSITETCVFVFSGASSSGKTTVKKVAMTMVGSSERVGPLNFTSRGLAEAAANSHDLPLCLDDAEKAEDLKDTLVRLTRDIAAGRSKQISAVMSATGLSQLKFRTFAMTSSPQPVAKMAAKLGWEMSRGDKVRIFDIPVPGPEHGGIFDRLEVGKASASSESVSLMSKLEGLYPEHCGHLFPLWIEYLLHHDCERLIAEYVDRFITKVGAAHHGWHKRAAQKFGLVYAALRIARTAGLLPWSSALCGKSVRKCYRQAMRSRRKSSGSFKKIARRLVTASSKPSRVVRADGRRAKPINLESSSIGIKYDLNGSERLGIFDEALQRICKTKRRKRQFTKRMVAEGIIRRSHGHAGTVQVRIPIRRGWKRTDKPMLWEFDTRRMREFCGSRRKSN